MRSIAVIILKNENKVSKNEALRLKSRLQNVFTGNIKNGEMEKYLLHIFRNPNNLSIGNWEINDKYIDDDEIMIYRTIVRNGKVWARLIFSSIPVFMFIDYIRVKLILISNI